MKNILFLGLVVGLTAFSAAETKTLKHAPQQNLPKNVPFNPNIPKINQKTPYNVPINSPVELRAMKVEHEDLDKKIPSFVFSLNSGSPCKEYVLVAKSVDGAEEVLHPSLIRNPNGLLMEGLEPFKLCTLSMGPGEPITVRATSKDGKDTAEISLVPRPLQVQTNGYTLAMQLADPENKSFQLHAFGFAPHEEVNFFTCSGSKQIRQRMIANRNGEIKTTLMHQTLGDIGGEAYLEIQGTNGTASMVYPWGTDYKKEIREIRKFERNLFKHSSV